MVRPQIQPTGIEPSGIVDSGRAFDLFHSFVKDNSAQILDIGCGNGAFLTQLKNRGFKNIFGIEAVEYPALKNFKAKFVDVSFESLPWGESAFDAVTAWEIFEHIENSRHLVRECSRILKPKGLLFISLPNVFHLMSRLMFLRQGNFPRWTAKNDHWNVFTHQLFQKTFLLNFDLVSCTYHRPEIGKGFLHPLISRLKFLNQYLPENELFSHFIVYVLKKTNK